MLKSFLKLVFGFLAGFSLVAGMLSFSSNMLLLGLVFLFFAFAITYSQKDFSEKEKELSDKKVTPRGDIIN